MCDKFQKHINIYYLLISYLIDNISVIYYLIDDIYVGYLAINMVEYEIIRNVHLCFVLEM